MGQLDKFPQRLNQLYNRWNQASPSSFADPQAVVIVTGNYHEDADIGYLKSFSLITWLFGAELQGVVIALSKHQILLAFAKQDYPGLSGLQANPSDPLPKITVISTEDKPALQTALKTLIADAPRVATLTKELPTLKGVAAEAVKAVINDVQSVNASSAIAAVLAVKDSEEEKRVRKASYLSAHVMKYSLIERIEKTIDQERKTSHSTLSDHAEEAIVNPSKVRLASFKPEFCDPCYPPIVQSAGMQAKSRKFDLRPSAESTDDYLAFGCIIASIGARFNFYCSNISRTLLIAPSKTQGAVYQAVLKAQEAAIKALLPGKPLKAAHAAAVKSLKSSAQAQSSDGIKMPDLVTSMAKNVGFGMGIEFRDSSFILNAKNETKVEKGMVFNVAVGVQNIMDPDNGNYSVLIADTVYVREEKMGPEIFTASSRKDFKNISYQYEAEEEDKEEDAENDDAEETMNDRSRKRGGRSYRGSGYEESKEVGETGRGRRRGNIDAAQVADNEEEEARRRKHQEMLAKKMLDRGRLRLKGGNILTIDDIKVEEKKLLDEVCAYDTPADFPTVRPRSIVVDMDAETVIVPIHGVPVPFHILALKNATKSDEGQYSYLRVNFHTPQAVVRSQGRPDNTPRFPGFAVRDDTTAAFIKEFTFRSSNPLNLTDCLRKIKELRKRANEKGRVAREKETLVSQQSLVLERRSLITLSEVAVRPPMAKGKNNVGMLEAHTNGFRYRCRSGNIEITYANIRNAFFQEADKELLVILHFHLKNAIIIGTKKVKDVQFYVQVMEAVVKLNENRRRQFDQDELEEEQRERELRNRTNRNFLKFTKQVEERYNLEFDIPYRQLQFTGAPRSVAVTLLPTVSCIVNLTEWPPFVLNLEDVEVAHFERVIFQLRMFDVVFVFKGFEDDPAATGRAAKDYWLRINSIPMEELTPLKRFLDEQNIKYYEGKASLQWNEVLKSVRYDLEEFYERGGWNFLSADEPVEGEENSEEEADSLDGDGEFAPSQSEDAYASSDETSEDSDSDAFDAKRELGGESDEGEDDLSSDEEGLEWDELERNAHADDLRKEHTSDDDGGRRRQRKNSRGDTSQRSGGPSLSSRKRSRRNR
ncbi:FACT complex subunit SPT16 [Gracilariopsis chorda]|uniref:FACT complex subunit n=1 Tax=Gracilariopsis chorda TaxID=448386 RepID=A0A2V3IKI3_9FLOR|nr:FACT complex subunit SPT16 [Gracilariopsis chorda]|eukprot:PXF42592.1 FACT complex subunit SPT16 [Gracilariopsis chorda]